MPAVGMASARAVRAQGHGHPPSISDRCVYYHYLHLLTERREELLTYAPCYFSSLLHNVSHFQ